MNARIAIWLLLPFTPIGLVVMLMADGVVNRIGLMIALLPLAFGGIARWRVTNAATREQANRG